MLDLYKNIKNERLKKGWTQTDLALKVGYSDKSMIAKIESGKVDLPQTKIRMFAQVFGCTESQLMGWDEESIKDTLIDAYVKNNKKNSITDEEMQIVQLYRSLDEDSKRKLILMLAFDKDQQNKK